MRSSLRDALNLLAIAGIMCKPADVWTPPPHGLGQNHHFSKKFLYVLAPSGDVRIVLPKYSKYSGE